MLNNRRRSQGSKINISKYLQESATMTPLYTDLVPLPTRQSIASSSIIQHSKDQTLKQLSSIEQNNSQILSDPEKFLQEKINNLRAQQKCGRKLSKSKEKGMKYGNKFIRWEETKKAIVKFQKQLPCQKVHDLIWKKGSNGSYLQQENKQNKGSKALNLFFNNQQIPAQIKELYEQQNSQVKQNLQQIFKVFSILKH